MLMLFRFCALLLLIAYCSLLISFAYCFFLMQLIATLSKHRGVTP
jgi:hypothetical protein